MQLEVRKPLLQRVWDLLITLLIVTIIGGILFWVYKNKTNTEFTVKKIGLVNYPNGIVVEFLEFNSSQMSCVASITTNQGSPYGTSAIFCK